MNFWNLLISSSVLFILLSGCSHQPKPPKEVITNKNLPTVQVNGFIADMNAIAFEWKLIEDPSIKGFYIYRFPYNEASEKNVSNFNTAPLGYYATVTNRFSTHYTDNSVKPNHRYKYRFATFNADNEQSILSETQKVSTLPVLASVSFIKGVNNLPRSAKLIWRPHTNKKVASYLIERSTVTKKEWQVIATINGRLSAEYFDNKLDDNAVYRYRIKAKTFDGILSTPSDIVTVTTKKLPAMVTQIKASSNLANQIKLTWAKSQESDITHYAIYRSNSAQGGFSKIATTANNSYTDTIKVAGKRYFYKISAIDEDGLESKLQESAAQGESLPKPATPRILSSNITAKKATFSWDSPDNKAVSYVVNKTAAEGLFEKKRESFNAILTTQYNDFNIKANTVYYYTVQAVDKHGIVSDESETVELQWEQKQ